MKRRTPPFLYILVVKNITEMGFNGYYKVRGEIKTGVKEGKLHNVIDKDLILSQKVKVYLPTLPFPG